MATSTPSSPTIGEKDFLADRQRFWTGFTRFTVIAASGIAILLILMAIFLV
jgi:hypothetical protein